jgi:hypothetical protein
VAALRLPLYLLAIPGCVILSLLLTVWGLTDRKVDELLAFSWLPLLAVVVGTCMLVYQSWSAIQDGQARTTPGRAVGFGFLPFFNLYWLFVVWPGFARDYNAYLTRHGIAGRPLPVGLYTAHAILTVLCAIPYLNLLTFFPALVTLTLVIIYNCRALDQLRCAATGQPPPDLLELARELGAKRLAAGGGGLACLIFAGLGVYFTFEYWSSYQFGQQRLAQVEGRLQFAKEGGTLRPLELSNLQREQPYYQVRIPRMRTWAGVWLVLTLAGLAGAVAAGWVLVRHRRAAG